MPVSTIDTAIGDQFLVGTEIESASPFQAHDVVLGVLLSKVTGFVTKSSWPRLLKFTHKLLDHGLMGLQKFHCVKQGAVI
jgi:hypothetical protein